MAAMKPHLLLLSLPSQGHINPMLQFASSLLARENCTITFVLTERSHSTILGADNTIPAHLQGIQFFTIPDGLPPDSPFHLDMSRESLQYLLNGIQQQQGLIESLIQHSNDNDRPISCIVPDIFFTWTYDLAHKFRIPTVPFWSSSATMFHIACLSSQLQFIPGADDLDQVAKDLELPKEELLAAFGHHDPKGKKQMIEKFARARDCSHVLVNSFHDLEAHHLPGAPSNLRYIGPCLSAATDMNARGSFYKEDEECLAWLDKQEKGSVVYISLGSVAFFSQLQMEEIAMGIEASNHKFLWVIRPDAQANSKLPEGFEERTKSLGMMISWAPQLRVLEHTAIGAFFTHCGWNSTLESIFMGVPMLCFPMFAEQPLNGLLIDRLWHVGIRFHKGEDGIVERGEVERIVKAVMEGEEGRKLRDQVLKLKVAARKACEVGGSSYSTLTSFFQELQSH